MAYTSSRQDRNFDEFLSDAIQLAPLETVADWIASNLDPDAVFSHRQLKNWAEGNGYVKAES